MYQESQIEINPLAAEVARLIEQIEGVKRQVSTANDIIESTRTTVRDWFIEQFDGESTTQIERDDVNELLESVDIDQLTTKYHVTLYISVTGTVEADDEEEAADLLANDISITPSDYRIDYEVDNSTAVKAD